MESDRNEITLKKEYFERLVRNTKRLERLASEILDVTKIDDQSLRLNKTYLNLKEIVLDLVQDHRRQLEKGNGNTKLLCEFKKEQEEEVPTRQEDFSTDIFINADKNRINQVIDNLLTNAIKFTKGIVSISITKKNGKNHTDAIIVRVRDTGTGIHPEILPRLFSKFATRSEIGTGQGKRLTSFEQNKDYVVGEFEDGHSERCDLLVGADGPSSTVRQQLLSDVFPRYAGYVAWRGVVDEDKVPIDVAQFFANKFTFFHGRNTQILCYLIPGSTGELSEGERRLNWVWYVNVSADNKLQSLLTDRYGKQRVFRTTRNGQR